MAIEFAWYMSCDGDSDHIGQKFADFPPSHETFIRIAVNAERSGFTTILVPTSQVSGHYGHQAPTWDSLINAAVIAPKTDELFTFSGDFEITEIIVANSQDEVSVDLPLAVSFSLSDAFPNPFNPTTTMTLTMPMSGDMKVEVYNLLGQVIATLASGYMDANTYTLTWDASETSSGLYFVKAQANGFSTTQKLMLIK